MISPSLSRVCISAQDLWSDVVTALLRRAYLTGGPISSEMRTMGDEALRRLDMCLPATPPNILQTKRLLSAQRLMSSKSKAMKKKTVK